MNIEEQFDRPIRTTHEETDGKHSMYCYFREKPIVVTKQKKGNDVIIDYDEDGKIIGVEVLWDD